MQTRQHCSDVLGLRLLLKGSLRDGAEGLSGGGVHRASETVSVPRRDNAMRRATGSLEELVVLEIGPEMESILRLK